MSIKRLFLLGLIFNFQFSISNLHAQSLTLAECKQKAHDNYPAIKQYGLVEKSRDLTLSNAAKAWLPGVSASAMGAIYTDILDLGDQQKAAFGDMKNYIYGASVMVQQKIYDGGTINAQKEIAKAQADVQQKQIDVNMYDINSRIEQLYFGILMLDEQLNQNRLLQTDFGLSQKTVSSLISGGLANQSDLDAVDVRIVQAQQQEISLKASRKTYLDMLGYFIGSSLSETTTLQRPSVLESAPSLRGRKSDVNNIGVCSGEATPQLSLFSSQENALSAQRKALDTRLMPTLAAFGLASAHSKIMPMTKWYNLGAGLMLQWNIGALYTRKNDIANIDNQRAQIAAQRETFLFNNNLQSKQSNGTIDNLHLQMQLDDKAISLRQNIRDKAEKKVKNGTETVNELLRDINSVSEAKQQKAIHEIQFLQEQYKLSTILNK